ncbi:galactitol-1-phosphate 5-dehydrogenase [bacterium]|nr:galactitol-1-phosphate 5-dehydrogenase [bacterium]
MKALVLPEYNRFAIQGVPQPEPGPGEVLIRVEACGICGSDVHGMDGSTGRRQPPVIMGHEAAGVIEEVGSDTIDWRPGDRVTFDSTVYCGACWFCRRGQVNLCDNRRVLGVSCDDYRCDGAFAEYVVVPQHILYRLPDGLSFERAAMVEGLSIAVHAAERARPRLGDTAVVVGAGMIGLLVVQVLRNAGCGQIIAVDLDLARLELARKLGANHGLKADETDVAREVRDMTGGRGADLAFEVVGATAPVHTALDCLRKGGTLGLVGNVSQRIDLPLQSVVTREITLLGSCASAGEYPVCLNLLAREAVQVDPLISAIAPLEEGPDWFKRLYDREPGLMKVILKPYGE